MERDYIWGEILIYRNALSDTDREYVEGYLAQKFGMSGQLPSDHTGLDQSGWALGRGTSSDGVSANLAGVGGPASGSESTISPSTDNQWHHAVSTFDGGTRKLYLDGVEVASQSASGSVSATATTLVFGAIDFNSSAAAEEEVKNIAAAQHSGIKLDEVRFYDSALSSAEITAMYNYGKGDLRQSGRISPPLPQLSSGVPGTALFYHHHRRFPQSTILCDLTYPADFRSILLLEKFLAHLMWGELMYLRTGNWGNQSVPQKSICHHHILGPVECTEIWYPGAANVLLHPPSYSLKSNSLGQIRTSSILFGTPVTKEPRIFPTGMVPLSL